MSIFDWINPPAYCDLKAVPGDAAGKLHVWREAVSHLFRVNSLGNPPTAELTSYALDRLQIGQITTAGQRISQRSGVDHLDVTGNAIVFLVLEGGINLQVAGVTAEAGPGDLCLLDAVGEYDAVLSGADVMFVAIPQELMRFAAGETIIFHGSVLPASAPSVQLLSRYLRELLPMCPRIGGADASRVAAALVSLVRATYQGFVPVQTVPDEVDGQSFLSEPLRRYVEAHLSLPDLTAKKICAAFGMSRAALYRMFAPVGGVSRYIRDQRVRKAAADIANPEFRRMRISSITKRWGFQNESSFAKALKRELGVAPMDLRRRADLATRLTEVRHDPAPDERSRQTKGRVS